MALIFVYGNSGSGKSEYMYQKFADMAEHAPYQHYFVVVPEQFTMSAQRKLVEHSSSGVITNIDVVSFERLAYRVFDELGVHRTVMEETGKSLVLRRIVEENESDLTILKRNLTKMGYIGELKSVISELMQYGISPDDLEDFIGELPEGSSLSYKLRDILRIYRSFDDYLGEGYVTAERVLDLLIDVAGESSLLKDAVFLFDGYTGFTPVQMNLIRRLMHIVSDIYVTVTLDTKEQLYEDAQMEDLFYMSRKMVNSLAKAAGEASFEIAEPVCIYPGDRSRFHDNPVLSHLEQNLFRVPGQTYEDPSSDHLRIVSLLSSRDELRFAAAGIRSIVREKGYRYRDCAIVCSDVQEYDKYAESIFSKYDIPVFIDKKHSILYHPMTELIRTVPELAESDYSRESVFRYLRTGLTGFTSAEVDKLENYCTEKGIRGSKMWREPFTRLPAPVHGRIRITEEQRLEQLEEINGIRERFVSQTATVIDVFCKKDATVRERTEALYGLLCNLSVEKQLRGKAACSEESGDELSSQINRQIYKIVIDLFDKMVDLLGDETFPVSDYSEIMEAGFNAARVGAIPPGNDCVILGDIERTRLDEIKVLFLLGGSDAAIPKKAERQSILSQHDRAAFEEHDIQLAPGEREQMFLQRFYLYLALTKPSDYLCLTFPRMGGDGKAVRPSYIVPVIEKLFKDLKAEEIAAEDLLPAVTAGSSIESYLTGLITSDEGIVTPLWKALHRWYSDHHPWSERIGQLFDVHFLYYRDELLDPTLAGALYGALTVSSVTRLEMFGKCAYSHFLEYGLRLGERKELSFDSPDMGTLFHETLKLFCERVDETIGWDNVTDEQQSEILREALRDAARENEDDTLFESASNRHMIERVYRILRTSIRAITEQIRRGDFHPEGYEIIIPGGRVDRMDICEEDDRVNVRVIDYKSSSTDLDIQNVYYGRQLQLPVYLNTAVARMSEKYPGREIVPAGIFYFHLDDPMLDDNGGSVDENQKKILNMMKPSGLVNSEPDVYCHMDRELQETGKSDVINITLDKDGNIRSASKKSMTTEEFLDLTRYVGIIMEDAVKQMLEGNISVNPYKMGQNSGCDYCRFKGVCGFDVKIPGFEYREEKKFPDDEVKRLIREQAGECQSDETD